MRLRKIFKFFLFLIILFLPSCKGGKITPADIIKDVPKEEDKFVEDVKDITKGEDFLPVEKDVVILQEEITKEEEVSLIECEDDEDCEEKIPFLDPCQKTICNKGVCVITLISDGTSCDDENLCTEDDICKNGKCTGSFIDCDDKNSCTADGCDPQKGCYHELTNGSSCDDGNPCTKDDVCEDGICKGVKVPCPCDVDDDCIEFEDGDYCNGILKCENKECVPDPESVVVCPAPSTPCKLVQCDPPTGECYEEDFPNGIPCSDDDLCTTKDVCKDGDCIGEELLCDDGNPCTDDCCDPEVGCMYPNNANLCDDGNICTKEDRCFGGVCKGGEPDSCDDENPCTEDKCDPAKGCINTPIDGKLCDDGNLCTVGEKCVDGVCKGGLSRDCKDGNPCTKDTCVKDKGCVYEFVEGECFDENVCTTGDYCIEGNCKAGTPQECDDKNQCTSAYCSVEKGCVFEKLSNVSCEDHSKCTQNDICKNGICFPGEIKNCEDGNECTLNRCLPDKGCVFKNIPKWCDDENECTIADTCIDGECKDVIDLECDDGNECTFEVCDPLKGCVYTPATGISCDDDNPCSDVDICYKGVCVQEKKIFCEDGNPCTKDWCNPLVGCIHEDLTGTPCEEGLPCTLPDVCVAGVCKAGYVNVCEDFNDCTYDLCNWEDGCYYNNVPDGTPCNDGNPCTKDEKCENGVCVGVCVPEGTPCADGHPCAWEDKCVDKYCVGPICYCKGINCNDGNQCTVDLCKDGECLYIKVPDGTPCFDGAFCTLNDKCIDGVCTPSNVAPCDDANGCTDDKCFEKYGCKHIPNTAPCSYKNVCIKYEKCENGGCVGGEYVPCWDDDVCSIDKCDPLKNCFYKASKAVCDDGNECTIGDRCKNRKCAPGDIILDCNDYNPCTNDFCDPAKGCVYTDNNNACDDDNKCTLNEKCEDGLCKGGNPLHCDDENPCTDDLCDPLKGCEFIPNSLPCNDGNICTKGDVCVSGVCKGITDSCDDGNSCTEDFCDLNEGCKHLYLSKGCDDGNPCTEGDFCVAGVCQGTESECDDNNSCTLDSCHISTGCAYNPEPFGKECEVEGNKYSLCVDGKCKSFTISVEKVPIEIFNGGRIGEEFFLFGTFYKKSGAIAHIGELDIDSLAIIKVAQFDGYETIEGFDGTYAAGSKGLVLRFKKSLWSSVSLPGLDTETELRAVEEKGKYYFFGGVSEKAEGKKSTWRCFKDGKDIKNCKWLGVFKSLSECNDFVKITVSDIYAVDENNVYFAGNAEKDDVAISFWDGNEITQCGGNTGFSGVSLLTENEKGLFIPGKGRLFGIDGKGSDNIWAVGEKGLVYQFNGSKWEFVDVSKDIAKFSEKFTLNDVLIDKDGGVHITGFADNVSVKDCREIFYLHGGIYEGKYKFDRLILFTNDLMVCPPGPQSWLNAHKILIDNENIFIFGVRGNDILFPSLREGVIISLNLNK